MGLSDEERVTQMCWAVHNLSTMCRELEVGYPKEPWQYLKDLGDRLWHAFLGGHSNGMFWIIGGALESGVTGPNSPWGVLIESQCDEARRSTEKDPFKKDPNYFDPFDGFLDISGLIQHAREGSNKKKLLDIYRSTEFLIYGLRRYDDELRGKYQDLDKLASDILGACFAIMHEDQDFGKAYVGERILKWIYGGYEDPLKKILLDLNIHHDLSRFMVDCTLADVIAWDKWRLTHKDCAQNRIVLALRMAGRGFHYEHCFKKLVEGTRGKNIREEVLRREFDKCVKAHEESESKQSREYLDDRVTEENIVIHGYGYSRDWKLKGED